MGIKVLFYILCSMVCAFFTIKMLLLRINEFKKYKISADDGKIKAVVVGHNAAYKGDICPIVSYVVDGNEKQYEYSFYHFEKEFPIGKEVDLKLSKASGLAYNKKDLIQGIVFWLFFTFFCSAGVLVGIVYIFLIH